MMIISSFDNIVPCNNASGVNNGLISEQAQVNSQGYWKNFTHFAKGEKYFVNVEMTMVVF